MTDITRRHFLGTTAAAVIVAGTKATGRVYGANERIRVGIIGLNGRGQNHLSAFASMGDVEIAALCDVDRIVLEESATNVEKRGGSKPALFNDIRELLDRDDIDAVSIATPNHWHSLGTVWACESGKDVYVEKPLSHELWEGRQAVAAAKKYKRIVQHGTQGRSNGRWRRDIKLMHDGFIGELHMAKGFTYKRPNRVSIGFTPPEEPPAHLDWTLWQGPAKEQAYCKNYVHYRWHWFWEYGNGELANQGVHQMDIAIWGMNRGMPVRVHSAGGRYHWNDQGETPNTQIVTYTYGDGTTMVFEVRNYGSYEEAGTLTTGNTFWGAKGYYVEGQGFFDRNRKPIPLPDDIETPKNNDPFENFINAMRTRKEEDIYGTVLNGHITSAHCHYGNIAYRVGRSIEIDAKSEAIVKDKEASALETREFRRGFEVPKLA